ncbi:uncharacterized protein LOC144360311, partial [Saccoglossus kowalevskii]
MTETGEPQSPVPSKDHMSTAETSTSVDNDSMPSTSTATTTQLIKNCKDFTALQHVVKSMEVQEKLYVIREEIDVVFENEDAADAGGPIRENFSLLFEKFMEAKLDMFITTATGYLLPTNNQRNVYGGLYEIVGTAVAAAAMNEALSPLPLHPAIIGKICGQDSASIVEDLQVDDIVDVKLHGFILKILECTAQDSLNELLNDDSYPTYYVDMCGWDNTCQIT